MKSPFSRSIVLLIPDGCLPPEGEDPPEWPGETQAKGPALLLDYWLKTAARRPLRLPADLSQADLAPLSLLRVDPAGRRKRPPTLCPIPGAFAWIAGAPDSAAADRHPLEQIVQACEPLAGPLGLKPVVLWSRVPGDDSQFDFLGVLLATAGFHRSLLKNSVSGGPGHAPWEFALQGGDAEGHGLRQASAALITALCLLDGASAGAAVETPKAAVRQTQADADGLIEIDHDLLARAREQGATVELLVELRSQRATLLIDGRAALVTRVCTGRPGKGTPTGSFAIREMIAKGKISNIYHVPLPYWMRLTAGGIGLHVGKIEDQPASAGCIRLPAAVAPIIFQQVSRGTIVRVVEEAPRDMVAANS